MARRMGLALGASLLLSLLGTVPASAGGFCSGYEGETFSDAAGSRVTMDNSCFSPIVLRVDEGARVAFVNTDTVPHAVAGAVGSFGDPHKEIAPGDRIAVEFDEEGVYPFACTFHPGMMGAVVVGDGLGDDAVNAAAAVNPAPPDSGANAQAAGDDESGSSVPLAVSLGIATVLLIAAVVSLATMARRKDKRAGVAPV